MLERCPNCQKLYPSHKGACGFCTGKSTPTLSTPAPTIGGIKRPTFNPRTTIQRSAPSLPKASGAQAPPPPSPRLSPSTQASQFEAPPDNTSAWTPENGGACPQCEFYNSSVNAFCDNCKAMLLKTTENLNTVASYPLKAMKGLVSTFIQKLGALGIQTTENLLRAGLSKRERDVLARKTGMSERSLLRLVHMADLCRIPDIDPEKAAMLELSGITTLSGFIQMDAASVYARFQKNKNAINQQGILVLPTKSQIEKWLSNAQDLKPLPIQ